MLAFDKAREINFIGPLGPPHTTFVEVACAIGLLHHFFVQEFADKLSIVALSDRVAKILPRVQSAPRFADTRQPRLQRPKVMLNAMITRWNKAEWVVDLDRTTASPAADRLLTSFSAKEDFYVYHVMLLDGLGIIVLGTVEY